MTELSKLHPGAAARITALRANGPLKRRLMDMGLLPGEVVTLVKVAPLGDPLEITVRGYHLSLRRSEADGVAVAVTP